jgi:8-oxo-dGTP pyrophosphatase MutT (NUDIX family)
VRVTSSRIVYENRWMKVHEDITELPDGSPGLYGWIDKRPATIIVPLDDDGVWLVELFRHPIGRRFWEFPQGSWEDEPPENAEALARGELVEETGLRADTLEYCGRLYFAYGFSNQPVDVWRATGLHPGPQQLEHTEQDLIARRFPREEVDRMIRENEIQDAASVAAWHLAGPRPAG